MFEFILPIVAYLITLLVLWAVLALSRRFGLQAPTAELTSQDRDRLPAVPGERAQDLALLSTLRRSDRHPSRREPPAAA